MNVPKWLEKSGIFARDIFVAFLGTSLADDKKTQETIGRELRKVLKPDREDVLKELNRLCQNGKAIRRLLKRANMFHGGVITVNLPEGNKLRRTENWVINRLLAVEPKDRQWMFARLNHLCKESPAAFLAELEILDDDWYAQYARLFMESIGNKTAGVGQQINQNIGSVANWLENLPGGGQ